MSTMSKWKVVDVGRHKLILGALSFLLPNLRKPEAIEFIWVRVYLFIMMQRCRGCKQKRASWNACSIGKSEILEGPSSH